MALILNIDTSTSVCSVALARDGKMIALKENNEGLNHSVLLGTYIDEILKDNHMDAHCLDAVAISMGPGSYTGLRIGVSMAKGVCFGAGKPLIAVPTLQALALSVSERIREEALYCPMIDARRMEVYCQLFDAAAKPLSEVTAHIVTPESFLEQRTEKGGLLVFGNGAAKSRELFTEPGVHFAEVTPSARGLVKPAFKAFAAKKFEDTAYFEPFYLKNFVVNCSSKKIF